VDAEVFICNQKRRTHVVEDMVQKLVGFAQVLEVDGHGEALFLCWSGSYQRMEAVALI
jgi:hypothetical protein